MAININHSGHDYEELARRWQILADSVTIPLETIATNEKGTPVLCLENNPESNSLPFYISAGVHGDECAPVWALLHWAERMGESLKEIPFIIFPCLNPHGLIENSRLDAEHRDLNRLFHDPSVPVIGAWQTRIAGKRFLKCLNLHEDYDATGIYLYDLSGDEKSGRKILEHCAPIIPIDEREMIDDQPFARGIHQHPKAGFETVVEEDLGGGYPEAIYLYIHHDSPCLTFETPSESDLCKRISAHCRAIEAFDPVLAFSTSAST